MISDDIHMKTYRALDLFVEEDAGTEVRCRCPFCGGKKLYLSKAKGFFDCKNCGRHGNQYTYMQYLYEDWQKTTPRNAFTNLSKSRGNLPAEAFIQAGVAFNKITKDWIIPVYNKEGALCNFRIWNSNTGVMKHLAGCAASLYGVESIAEHETVFVCEGEWDAIALRWLLSFSGEENICVVAVPGAQTFKENWGTLFNKKHVILAYDNDKAGQDGLKRVIKIFQKFSKPASVKVLKWDQGLPDKYDIRDFICDNLKNSSTTKDKIWNMLSDCAEEDTVEELELVRTSFEEVVEDYSNVIYLNEDMKIALLLLFSTIFANKAKDSPLWLFVVGASGAGKSLILQSVAAAEDIIYVSNMTSKTLISGFKRKDGSDPSLLPRLIGKTLVLKEFTEILNMPIGEQEEIFDQLRGAYDGRVDKEYGNGVVRTYPEPGSGLDDCHFTLIAGVTNIIHGRNRAALGERFLKFQMGQGHNEIKNALKAAVANILEQKIPEKELKRSAAAFIRHKLEQKFIPPEVPVWIQERVIGLAQIVGHVRAFVERDAKGNLVYRPVAEVGTRLAKQLIKLVQMISFTLGKEVADEYCYSIVKRVALDTAYGWNRDIILEIAKEPEGLTAKELQRRAVIKGLPTVELSLENLYELKAIDYEIKHDGHAGRDARYWKLTSEVAELFEMADMFGDNVVEELPAIPGKYRRKVGDEHRKTKWTLAKSMALS